jgi:hypothetical protein
MAERPIRPAIVTIAELRMSATNVIPKGAGQSPN